MIKAIIIGVVLGIVGVLILHFIKTSIEQNQKDIYDLRVLVIQHQRMIVALDKENKDLMRIIGDLSEIDVKVATKIEKHDEVLKKMEPILKKLSSNDHYRR